MKAPIRWHADARRLRNDGLTAAEIVAALNRSQSIVYEVLAASRIDCRAAPRGDLNARTDDRRPLRDA